MSLLCCLEDVQGVFKPPRPRSISQRTERFGTTAAIAEIRPECRGAEMPPAPGRLGRGRTPTQKRNLLAISVGELAAGRRICQNSGKLDGFCQ
jgi:hypothetical protein